MPFVSVKRTEDKQNQVKQVYYNFFFDDFVLLYTEDLACITNWPTESLPMKPHIML